MSQETIDTFKAMKHWNRQEKTLRRQDQHDAILKLEKEGFDCRVVNGNEHTGQIFCVRVNGLLDLWITNKKYHSIKNNMRGKYEDVYIFVHKFFNGQ